ncbi:MAG TPA: hypothetical protein EYP56_03930 [Planctomycetaceae bacterium]|nr:hypothetical protein [Planctomycetaceae bacterium]
MRGRTRAFRCCPPSEADSFGVGWYYLGTSSESGPLASLGGPVADGQGVEVFYNWEVSPWFHLTTDLQVMVPARKTVGPTLVLGFRAKMDF